MDYLHKRNRYIFYQDVEAVHSPIKILLFEFASWISPEFKLYVFKDYQRLKIDEASRLEIGLGHQTWTF